MPTLTAPAFRGARGAAPSVRAPVSDRALSVLGAISLLGLAASSLTFVAIAANRPSFLAPPSRSGFFALWMVGSFAGLWPGSGPSGVALGWTSSALLVAMYGLYAVAWATARRLRARWTIVTVVAVHVIFLLAPPLSYTDVFNYLGYGGWAFCITSTPTPPYRSQRRTPIRASCWAIGTTCAARTVRCSRSSPTRSFRSASLSPTGRSSCWWEPRASRRLRSSGSARTASIAPR